jgi:hypothetical protein
MAIHWSRPAATQSLKNSPVHAARPTLSLAVGGFNQPSETLTGPVAEPWELGKGLFLNPFAIC